MAKAAHKIIDGLKSALNIAKCSHEFTYWVKHAGNDLWSRTCTKCHCIETRRSSFEPGSYE